MSLYPNLPDSESADSSIESFKMSETTLSLGMAFKLIPEYNGNREELQKFISSCELSLNRIAAINKPLLFELIKTKISGKAYNVIRFRPVESWEALRLLLEEFFIEKRTVAILQLGLTTLRQKTGESVRSYAQKMETLLGPLIDLSIEGKSQEAGLAIQTLLKAQALNVFQEGLLQPIKLLVKSKNVKEFEDAIAAAVSEECTLLSDLESQKFFGLKNMNDNNPTEKKSETRKCFKCGREGHISSQCYTKKTSLAQSEGQSSKSKQKVYVITCHYCKKQGHIIKNCYSLKNKERKKADLGNCSGTTESNLPAEARKFK
jgi:Zinc knuckle